MRHSTGNAIVQPHRAIWLRGIHRLPLGIAVATLGVSLLAAPALGNTSSTGRDAHPADVYPLSALIAPDALASEQVGGAVSVRGNWAALGASARNSGQGAVYMFNRSGGSWTEKQGDDLPLVVSDGQVGDGFGSAVGISGAYLVVGAPGTDGGRGAAYVFHFNGTKWSMTYTLVPSPSKPGDQFGAAVAISGNRIVVGAPGSDNNSLTDSGAAYVFAHSGALWPQLGEAFTGFQWFEGALGGMSVAFAGDRVIVGAPHGYNVNEQDTGTVDSFIWDADIDMWLSDPTFEPDQPLLTGYEFGTSIAGAYGRVIVGAPGANGNAGRAYVFAWDPQDLRWEQRASLTGAGQPDDRFGAAVGITGSFLNRLLSALQV